MNSRSKSISLMWSQYLSQRDINQLIYGHYGDHRHCEWACVEQSESRIWGISLSGPFAMTTERVQRSEQHRLIQWIIWKTDWAREWVEVGAREREIFIAQKWERERFRSDERNVGEWSAERKQVFQQVYLSFVGYGPKCVCLYFVKVCPQQTNTSQDTAEP